ncbi:MAG: adenylate/guanylate cyclase domain-containing protein, partial [Myxococcota bacterium]|nr:adenylate/guanylate cyclase domain-containing protein [Myxococcota bacterium]
VALLVGINRVRTVQQGDALLVVGTAAGLMIGWFQLMMKLPTNLINDCWLVTVALMVIVVLVLLETTLLTRLGLASLTMAISLTTPVRLGIDPGHVTIGFSHVLLIFLVGWVAAWQVEVSRRLAFARQLGVEGERARTVGLLRNILPVPIADRLLSEPGTIAERYSTVTVLFADIVGFTPWASSCDADEIVEVLDRIFSAFDALCDEHDVEKIKTIGDAYMAAGGVPTPDEDGPAKVVRLALAMMKVVAGIPVQQGTVLQLRIGIHQGPVVAGVIGRRKFIYDLWGDTVNTAARMESHGVPGRVQVSEMVAEQLDEEFVVEKRGVIEVKGKGTMVTYLVGSDSEGV